MGIDYWKDSDRLQFTIPASSITADTHLIPFIFKLGDSSGKDNTDTTFIFDKLESFGSSISSRKKVAFSQVVSGSEVLLFAELDFWNHISKNAIFWVKPITLSPEHVNIFYFYYDKSKEVNDKYISEANQKSIRLMIPLGSQGVYDLNRNIPFTILKHNNKYIIWYLGLTSSISQRQSIIYCESTDLIDFTNFQPVTSVDNIFGTYAFRPGTVFFKDGVFMMWAPASTLINSSSDFSIYYFTSLDGISWSSSTPCVGLLITATTFGQSLCSVIFVDSLFKIWFQTATSGVGVYSIFYAESLDGINWYNLVEIIEADQLPKEFNNGADFYHAYLCRVLFTDGKYLLWLKGDVYATASILCCESYDGKNFSNFRKFSDPGIEGTYDYNGYNALDVLIDEERVIFLCAALSDNNTDRLFISTSAYIYKPMTPSQLVWEDLFTSVLHLNPSFGYINSACSPIGVVSLNDTSISYDNLQSATLNFNSSLSKINLGNNYIYDYGNYGHFIMWANLLSGRNILSKGSYSETTTTVYFQDTPPVFRENYSDNFSGEDGSFPDDYLWTINAGSPRIFNDKLKFGASSIEALRSNFYIGTNAEMIFNFSVVSGTLTNNWKLGFKLKYFMDNADLIFYIYRSTVDTSHIYLGTSAINSYGLNWSTGILDLPYDYFNGSFRMLNEGNYLCFDFLNNDSIWQRKFSFDLTNTSYNTHYQLEFFKTDALYRDITSFNIDYYTINSESVFKSENFSDSSQALVLDSRLGYVNSSFNYLNYIIPSRWSLFSFGICNDFTTQNTILGDSDNSFYYKFVPGFNKNNKDLIIGGYSNSMLGNYSEIFFTRLLFTDNDLNILKSSLEDDLIVFSTHYVRGYTTLYNNATSSEVFVYDQLNGDLIGKTISNTSTGFYYTQLPYVEKCFVVGFGDDLYNHFVLSDVTLQTI